MHFRNSVGRVTWPYCMTVSIMQKWGGGREADIGSGGEEVEIGTVDEGDEDTGIQKWTLLTGGRGSGFNSIGTVL